MPRQFVRVSVVVTLLVLILAIAIQAQRSERSPLALIGKSQYEACGLHKLTMHEQENVLSLMTSGSAESYLEESAANLMKKNDWEQVHVIGVLPEDPARRTRYVLVSRYSELFTLEPSIIPHLPDPGLYWAKVTGSSWKLLYPEGEEVSFWSVTEKGLNYGKNLTSPNCPRETQPHWYVERFGELATQVLGRRVA